MSIKIGINGFGRIGRLVFRASLKNPDVEVVAINDLTDTKTIAHLLKYDSVHGQLDLPVSSSEGKINVDGKDINVSAERDPGDISSKHLKSGPKKVIISAPANEPDITIVLGVNDKNYDPSAHHIISNASCTTNCLAPVAKVLHENFEIQCGMITTVHAYTGDQRILDFPHKDLRRARAAAVSMIPTTTGAAKAVGLVLPDLQGKLNGLSVRVPTPNVSLVDLVAIVKKDGLSKQDINNALKTASENELSGILGFSELPLVSIDFNGSPLSSIVDADCTDVIDNLVKIYSWYDNEAGYSARMVDLIAMVGKSL